MLRYCFPNLQGPSRMVQELICLEGKWWGSDVGQYFVSPHGI